MMTGAATSPTVLRLVNADARTPSRFRHATAPPAQQVRAENSASARLGAADARWVLAVRTTMALQGGRAAILRPDDRRRLTVLAVRMGLRSFDAALVIAIVQDAARTGEPLSGPPQDRLAMVPGPRTAEDAGLGAGPLLLVSFFLGLLMFSILRIWLLG